MYYLGENSYSTISYFDAKTFGTTQPNNFSAKIQSFYNYLLTREQLDQQTDVQKIVSNKSLFSDPYVKVYLKHNGERISKAKTHVKKNTLNPVFDESFAFDVPKSGIKSISLELMVVDWDRMSQNDVSFTS